MKNMVYLVETQVSEWDFFRENLADFSLRCVDELEDVEADAKAVSVFVHSRVDEAFLQAHPGVKLVTTRSTGHDHIDRAECTRRGVTVCNVSSVDENTVAEHTFALILAVARRLQEVREANKQPHFRYETLRAWDLRGKTLGVIGTGRVGLRVIHIGLAFGMKVLAYDPYSRSLMAELLGVRYVDLGDLLGSADVITLHAPLTPETHHLLDREAFARCQEGIIVINTARGGLIRGSAAYWKSPQDLQFRHPPDTCEIHRASGSFRARIRAANPECAAFPALRRQSRPQRSDQE